jgi:hypothetical protein
MYLSVLYSCWFQWNDSCYIITRLFTLLALKLLVDISIWLIWSGCSCSYHSIDGAIAEV